MNSTSLFVYFFLPFFLPSYGERVKKLGALLIFWLEIYMCKYNRYKYIGRFVDIMYLCIHMLYYMYTCIYVYTSIAAWIINPFWRTSEHNHICIYRYNERFCSQLSVTLNEVSWSSKTYGNFRHNHIAIYDFTVTGFYSFFFGNYLVTTMISVTRIPLRWIGFSVSFKLLYQSTYLTHFWMSKTLVNSDKFNVS